MILKYYLYKNSKRTLQKNVLCRKYAQNKINIKYNKTSVICLFTRHTQSNVTNGTTFWTTVGYFNIHIPVYLMWLTSWNRATNQNACWTKFFWPSWGLRLYHISVENSLSWHSYRPPIFSFHEGPNKKKKDVVVYSEVKI